MEDIVAFLVSDLILVGIVLLFWGLKQAGELLLDKFVEYICKRIKEKEMGDYIEHQFDDSRRKHSP